MKRRRGHLDNHSSSNEELKYCGRTEHIAKKTFMNYQKKKKNERLLKQIFTTKADKQAANSETTSIT